MRGDLRALRSLRQMVRVETGPGCRVCSRQDIAPEDHLCGRCRKELCPTPLDQVLLAIGWSDAEFAEATGIPPRTIARVSKGTPVGPRVAKRFARITGLPERVFLDGVAVRVA